MDKCPACTKRVVPTYEGFQAWCTGCGRLFWLHPDGTVRGTQVPTIIATHEICHDLDGNVGPMEFAAGCTVKQRERYGCAPDADRAAFLEARVNALEAEAAANAKIGREPGW